jgi:hypothetical protein
MQLRLIGSGINGALRAGIGRMIADDGAWSRKEKRVKQKTQADEE